MKYQVTYYYCNFINNILCNKYSSVCDIEDFFEDDYLSELDKPFSKKSIFHKFIRYIIINELSVNCPVCEDNRDTFLDDLFNHYNIPVLSYDKWVEGSVNGDFFDYFFDLVLDGNVDSLIELISDEVFYIMFMNRKALLKFNEIASHYVSQNICKTSSKKFWKTDGKLKRVYIPKWVKKAVYFRDRGQCVLCGKDLSGCLSINNKLQYDHIVPLAKGGLNDISNMQLLCENCNKLKLDDKITTSEKYERWYNL